MCYFSVHNHSMYSNIRLLDSINRPEELIQYANDIGLKGICLSDHECLSGHVKFIKSYKELKEKGKIRNDFRIGLGNEIYLVHEDTLEELQENYKNKNPDTKFYHFLLIAKDPEGYEQLKILSSMAWENMFTTGYMERVPTFKSNLAKVIKGGHVIATTACLGGFVPQMILKWREEENKGNQENVIKYKRMLHEFVTFCIDVFGKDNFYFECQPSHQEEQNYVNRKLIELSKVYGIKYIIATDGHYLKKEDREAHRIYLQSQEGDREVDDFYQSAYVMSVNEIKEAMDGHLTDVEIQEGFNNTLDILNKIEFFDLARPVVIPQTKIEDFELAHIFKPAYHQYEYIEKFANSPHKVDRYLMYLIEAGFNEKLRNKPLSREYFHTILQRINTELGELWKISEKLNDRMSAYYVLTRHVIDLIWEKGDSLVGVSRGSSAGFLINYLIDIVQENPLDYNLPHFRHLTAERPELPDIDIDSQQNRRGQILQALKDEFGERRVLNIATFGTEGSRSTLLSVCRGMGIDVDEAQYLTTFIPQERGQSWSLSDCIYGNPEKDRHPIKEFVRELEKYPGLIETALKIENLVKSRSVHASGVYIYNDDFTKFNAMMRASSGQPITAFDMADSDYMGNLKIDLLTVQALDRIRTAMELLIKDGYLEWQGSLRATYNKYLHPDVLNYDDKEMWKKVADNAIPDLFQFDTPVGLQCARKVKPTSVTELAVANSLMRLMSDGDEQPVDKYVRHKNNPEEWYQEMKSYGLTEDEIQVLRKHLDEVYGVSESQELMMLLSMDEKIANFSVKDSNALRKGVAKKKEKLIQEAKENFFKLGRENGASDNILNYVWTTQIQPQCGYSFSRLHSVGYSLIALQELNLAHFYPQIYWDCACLTINAGADEDNEDNKGTNYGKVAAAIGAMQKRGVKVALPDINHADFGFKPDVENNQIIFGLKAVNGISDEIAELIIQHRPYSSFEDFITRMYNNGPIKKAHVIQLIKAGSFDSFGDRVDIMKQFINIICEPKEKLTMQNFNTLINLGVIPDEYALFVRFFNFKKYISQNVLKTTTKPKDKWLILDDKATQFFNLHFTDESVVDMHEGKLVISEAKFKKEYDQKMETIKKWVSSKEALDLVNEALFNEAWEKYAEGTISKWEMDSVSYYDHEHELAHVNNDKYGIVDFFSLPEEPPVVGYYKSRGQDRPKYQIVRIAGTVLDKNNYKHTITLLTTTGVVTVKFNDGQFAFYARQISKPREDGTKEVIEKGWFTRGNKLLIAGYRRGSQFRPYKYTDSIYSHTTALITKVHDNGDLTIITERAE
jgi:DNA polymerase III subunit alpha